MALRILVATLLSLALLLPAGSSPAWAQSGSAPYCSGLSCSYFDITSCQKAAGAGNMCRVNPSNAKAKDFKGGGAICGVSPVGGNCFYFDLKSCQQAVGPGGTCVGAPRR